MLLEQLETCLRNALPHAVVSDVPPDAISASVSANSVNASEPLGASASSAPRAPDGAARQGAGRLLRRHLTRDALPVDPDDAVAGGSEGWRDRVWVW